MNGTSFFESRSTIAFVKKKVPGVGLTGKDRVLAPET
jgi:hypothetical protein